MGNPCSKAGSNQVHEKLEWPQTKNAKRKTKNINVPIKDELR